VVGFDLVELHPALDPTYKTTLNSAHIINACPTGLAMNKEGLTADHYLSPLSSEHAIDDYYGDQQEYLDTTAAEEESDEEEKASEELTLGSPQDEMLVARGGPIREANQSCLTSGHTPAFRRPLRASTR